MIVIVVLRTISSKAATACGVINKNHLNAFDAASDRLRLKRRTEDILPILIICEQPNDISFLAVLMRFILFLQNEVKAIPIHWNLLRLSKLESTTCAPDLIEQTKTNYSSMMIEIADFLGGGTTFVPASRRRYRLTSGPPRPVSPPEWHPHPRAFGSATIRSPGWPSPTR